jgi:hypothetical protein
MFIRGALGLQDDKLKDKFEDVLTLGARGGVLTQNINTNYLVRIL